MDATERGDEDPMLSAIFDDVVADVLCRSASGQRHISSNVARALRRLFTHESGAITVICRSHADPTGEGARSKDFDAEALSVREIQEIVLARAPRPEDLLEVVDGMCLAPRWSARFSAPAPGEGEQPPPDWAFQLNDRDGDSRVLIVVERPTPERNRRFFEQYVKGLLQLHRVVTALRGAQDIVRWNRRLDDQVVNNDRQSLAQRLESGTQLLVDLAACRMVPEHLELIRRLATWAVQEQLGTGWGVRRLDGEKSRGVLLSFKQGLREVLSRHRKGASDAELAVITEVEELIHMFAAEVFASSEDWRRHVEADDAESRAKPALRLLRASSLLHERAFSLAESAQEHDTDEARADERAWDELAEKQLGPLAAFLADPRIREAATSPGSIDASGQTFTTPMLEAAGVRNWLCVWFCHTLLTRWCAEEELRGGVLDRWEFRKSIAYVIRESLRFHLYRKRPDYRYQPAAYTAALRTLVEQHCHWCGHIDEQFDVRWLLQEIGEVRAMENYYFATGHLKHVLEVYIAGHFLCSIRVEDPAHAKRGWTLGEILAAKGQRSASDPPHPDHVNDLLQSFSIAALSHDLGMILFPILGEKPEKICRNDPELLDVLGKAHEDIRSAAVTLVERCSEYLVKDKVVDGKAAWWQRWIAAQKANCQPNHSLLGAWYLSRLCANLDAESSDQPALLREAKRAVLLHGAVCESIDVATDPAAALLVLCDEIFEWEPVSRAAPGPNAVGRSLHAMAVDLRPLPMRVARFGIAGLGVKVVNGKLDATISATSSSVHDAGRPSLKATMPPLPAVFVELEHPEFLDVPTYRIILTVAQNFGRISPSNSGWAPHVHLTAQPQEQLQTTFVILQRLGTQSSLPIRKVIYNWLVERDRLGQWRVDAHKGREHVLLTPLSRPIHTEDIRGAIPQIEEAMKELGLKR